MQIRIGYEIDYECPQPTPMILTLHVHSSRVADLVTPDRLTTTPAIPVTAYHDTYGNWCSRIVAPTGRLRLTTNALLNDHGRPDTVVPWAQQHDCRICQWKHCCIC